jgi:hypothetical protein
MYNLRKIRGTLKGSVGEAIFISIKNHTHATKFDSYEWLNKLNHLEIPKKILNFLKANWATIDVFEFIVQGNFVTNLILYEIKTLNNYSSKGINFGRKPVITQNSLNFYLAALNHGYIVKSVYVILYDNWEFDINVNDFLPRNFNVWDGNPKYSKAAI